MSILESPKLVPPSATILLINNVAVTTTSAITAIDGLRQSLVLQVTGTWRGAVIVEGRVDGLDWIQLEPESGRGSAGPFPATVIQGLLAMGQITRNGLYYFNVAGLTSFRVRALPTLGNVTVNGKLLSNPAPKPLAKRVSNAVAESYQTAVAAGATTTIFNSYDVSAFPMIAFAFVSETVAGGWQTQLKYIPQFNRNTAGGTVNSNSPVGALTMIDTTIGRAESDFIFTKGEHATVQITNLGPASHTYDVYILGIR